MEGLETKQQVETLITEKANAAAEKFIKEHGADFVKSEAGKKYIQEMFETSFDSFKFKHADNDVTLAQYVNVMQKQFDDMAIALKEEKCTEKKSFEQYLAKELNSVGAKLLEMKDDSFSKGVKLDVKAAATMLINTNYTGTYALTQWDPEFARVPRRQPFMRQLVRVIPTTSKYIAWAEQANPDGGAGNTAEGALKSQADFDIVERTAEVVKITAYIKVSREMLADLPFIQGEINTELRELINLRLDSQILSGNGTTPNLKGILTYVTQTFARPTGVTTVQNANRYDVIRAAITQIVVNSNGAFTPNYVIVNPVDLANMEFVKDVNGQYVMPPFSTANGMNIGGVTVVANVGVNAGDFLIGDFSKDTLAIREELNISVGYENDDFTRNLVTILGELRAANYIKSNHLTAFVKGTFATAITALAAA